MPPSLLTSFLIMLIIGSITLVLGVVILFTDRLHFEGVDPEEFTDDGSNSKFE